MLSAACRRFLAGAALLPDGRHAQGCARCAAFVRGVAAAAAAAQAVEPPPALAAQLAVASGPPRAPRLPEVPLPPALAARLVRMAGSSRRPPAWLASSRYTVAASLVAACLAWGAVGDPVVAARRMVAAAAGRVTPLAETAGSAIEARWTAAEGSASEALRGGRKSLERVGRWAAETVTELSVATPSPADDDEKTR